MGDGDLWIRDLRWRADEGCRMDVPNAYCTSSPYRSAIADALALALADVGPDPSRVAELHLAGADRRGVAAGPPSGAMPRAAVGEPDGSVADVRRDSVSGGRVADAPTALDQRRYGTALPDRASMNRGKE